MNLKMLRYDDSFGKCTQFYSLMFNNFSAHL